jgi:hypothetical protein
MQKMGIELPDWVSETLYDYCIENDTTINKVLTLALNDFLSAQQARKGL